MIRRLLSIAAIVSAVALPAIAHEYKVGSLTVDHPFSRATTAQNGAAYMTIENRGAEADRLVRASTARAAKVELHTIVREGDVMKMREVSAIDVPARGKAELKPGGFHVMLLGLKAPLREGEKFNLALEFEKAGKVEVTVQIDKAGATGGHGHPAHPPAKAP
jgi:copper(I)-binding protein